MLKIIQVLNNQIADMSAPYFVVASTGRLNVTAAGAKVLQTYTGRPSCPWYATGLKPGSKIRADLQKNVKDLQTACGFPNVTPTNHHILPGKTIVTTLTGALKQHTNSIDLVNNYINSRKGIQGYLLDLVKRKDEKQALDQVYAAVFWHEFNLVLGPTNRNNEPGDQIDYEVLGVQTDAVKKDYKQMDTSFKAADYYAVLDIFLKRRTMFNGDWKVAVNNKWNLFPSRGPSHPPATAGFAYDIWPFY